MFQTAVAPEPPMKEHRFEESDVKGKQGEYDIYHFFSQLPSVKEVIDVRNNSYYRGKDIDFLVKFMTKDKKNKVIPVEVKADYYHYTGNLFFETTSNDKKNTPGCFVYSEAKMFCYYYPKIKQIYMFDLPKVRKWFFENRERHNFKVREIKNYKDDKYIYSAWGSLVPKTKLKQECTVHVIDLNDELTVKRVQSYYN